jgi:hypothetical protein
MPIQDIGIFWPRRGISDRFAFSDQPPDTARDGSNVLGLEKEGDRFRGGQRPGHSKYITPAVNGASPVLDLGAVIGDDRQVTYSLLAAANFESVWRNSTPSGAIEGATANYVDFTGNLYLIDSPSSFTVFSSGGEMLTSVQVPVLTGTVLRRIVVDETFNVFAATGALNTLVPAEQPNSRIYKYRPLANGAYILDWTLAPTMQTTGLLTTSTVGTVCFVASMLVKGTDLWVGVSDHSPGGTNQNAEVHRYEHVGSTVAPIAPKLAFGVQWQPYGLAVREDGFVFVAAAGGTGATHTETLTKYDQAGTQVWQANPANGGYGWAVVLDSNNNLFTVGQGGTAGTGNWVKHWLDGGTTVTVEWSVAQGGVTFSAADAYVQISVDVSDNVYVPWPGNSPIVATDDVQVSCYSVLGALIFAWPDDGLAHGPSRWVSLPPTRPDYDPDPVTVDEFFYYGGRQGTGTSIVSSTNATPIVLTIAVDFTGILLPDDALLVDSHLVNIAANGRQIASVVTATTIALKDTVGVGVGGATGAFTALPVFEKIKTVLTTPTSGSTRTQKVLAVAGGAIKVADLVGNTWDDPAGGGSTSLAPALDPASEYISSADMFGQRFFTDSVQYVVYDLATDTVTPFVATVGDIEPRCKLLTVWNARLVVARSADDPHGWFMSAAGDAFNWDYFPRSGEVSPTTAVAGANSDAGRVADVINGLIPWNDLLLFFMCDHSIWRMTGDPMDNGRIDNVSKTIGMSFGGAWARDPIGILYFYSAEGGVYRLHPDGVPESISVDWIERRLRDVDLTSRLAKLEWNYVTQGLEVFICARDGAGATQQEHYFWEQRTGAWYPVEFSNVGHEPTALLVLDGDAPEDRIRLIAGEDGIVRKQDLAVRDDDGSPIDSFIILGPYTLRGMDRTIRMLFGRITLANDQPGGVNWKLYATDRAEVMGAPIAQGWIEPGRSPNLYGMRGRGQFFYLELRNSQVSSSWAFEQGLMRFATAGRARSVT